MTQKFHFLLAEVPFLMESDRSFCITKPFQAFSTKERNIHKSLWKLSYREVGQIPNISGKEIHHTDDYRIVQNADGLTLIYIDRDSGIDYTISQMDVQKKEVIISFLSGFERFFSETGNCFFHSQWEKVLMEEGRLLLHASCIHTNYGGILFSGISGIGKSTQSDLWIAKEKAKLINGDRPILAKTEQGWHAYGSPYAGSSRCHINESTPIRCIVLLQQGKENQIRKLDFGEAFQKVYRNITANVWDQSFVGKAVDRTYELVMDIPVYDYSCLPDESAVETLKAVLEK